MTAREEHNAALQSLVPPAHVIRSLDSLLAWMRLSIRLAPYPLLTLPHLSPEIKTYDANGSRVVVERGRQATNWVAKTNTLNAAKEVHPRGFEPLTFGSVDRCSIQLS